MILFIIQIQCRFKQKISQLPYSESKIEYPDNYAGAYYDSDNKRLNIILTDDNSDIYMKTF